MAKYDTMSDDDIDLLIAQAEARGRRACFDEMLKEAQEQRKEAKDGTTGKKQ